MPLPTVSPSPVQATVGTAALSLLQRNSLPSTHIRCRTTARRLATATMARRIPRRRATRRPHAFSHDHFLLLDKQGVCGLVEHRAQQGVATFGHPAVIVDLAGLVALRYQADMRADRPGMDKALRLVDRRTVGQRYDRADPWGGHQSPAHRVAADRVEQHLVQDGELLAHDPADVEQRLGDRGQPSEARDEFADPRLVSTATDDAYFQTEIAQRAAQIGLQVQQLALKQLAAR